MSKLPISAIVVNHNGGALLSECVRSAIAFAMEIIVVDNLSTDSSMDVLESTFRLDTSVVLIRSDANLGFATGCNTGISRATQPYMLFLNPDCVMQPTSIPWMFNALISELSVGMVGGRLINPDGSEQGGGRRAVPTPWRSFVRAFGLTRLSNRWPRLFFDFYLHNQPLPLVPVEVEAISGALMLVKRSALDGVGPWDEAYFLHCEDLDLCMRFRQKQWRILFVPNAPVVHYQGGSSRSKPLFVEWHKHKGMVRFYRKFFSHQYPWGLMWLVYFGVWFRFVLVVIRHGFSKAWKLMRGKHE